MHVVAHSPSTQRRQMLMLRRCSCKRSLRRVFPLLRSCLVDHTTRKLIEDATHHKNEQHGAAENLENDFHRSPLETLHSTVEPYPLQSVPHTA
jgi:hypothetical protein